MFFGIKLVNKTNFFFTNGISLLISLSNICQTCDLTGCFKIHDLNAHKQNQPLVLIKIRVPIIKIKFHCKHQAPQVITD